MGDQEEVVMSSPKRLTRRSSSGKIAGVCAGIAEYLSTDVALIRLVWIVLSIVPGGFVGGLVAYVAAWLIMPDSREAASAEAGTPRLTRSTVDRKVAGVCGGIADYMRVDSTVVRLAWAILTVVPGAIVLGVVAYAVAWFIMPEFGGAQAVATSSVA
jgi:phage shock protein PspC (stress-responsive transcriptional regulator)